MNKEEIEKILDRLERIDHKEYSCSFEFADSGSFEETCICFDERKKLANHIKQLQKQLDYLRSGEYYNQLRFERNMLEDLVDKGKISKEDKQFINCTHRNTELLEENKQLKENWNNLKEYCQNNSFMQNTREYGTLTVVDADELAIYMQELESGDSNE